MGEKPQAEEAAPAAKEMTTAEAARRVSGKVRVIKTKDGKPIAKGGVFQITEPAAPPAPGATWTTAMTLHL